VQQCTANICWRQHKRTCKAKFLPHQTNLIYHTMLETLAWSCTVEEIDKKLRRGRERSKWQQLAGGMLLPSITLSRHLRSLMSSVWLLSRHSAANSHKGFTVGSSLCGFLTNQFSDSRQMVHKLALGDTTSLSNLSMAYRKLDGFLLRLFRASAARADCDRSKYSVRGSKDGKRTRRM